MDQDLWLKALHFHGPLLLQTAVSDVSTLEGEVENEKLAMCKFIKNKQHLLFKPSESNVSPPSDHAIPPVPVELFRNASLEERRDLFYKSLDRGNILILRVINDTLNDDFKLLVLCKQNWCMKLDDLSLVMYLPKLPAEIALAGGKLESNELIRAAVCSCCVLTRKLNVTLDSNVLDDENVKLGKISENDLPFYIKNKDTNKDFGSSYVEYLHHSPQFNNPNWAESLTTVLNIDRKYSYSFLEERDGKKYPAEEYGTELKKRQDLKLAQAQYVFSSEKYTKAVEYYEAGNFTDAFICLNSALRIYPKNTEALVLRGTLYANTNNLTKAFVDLEEALTIDQNHEAARKQLATLLVAVAKMHMSANDKVKAQESLVAALQLDSNNQDAIQASEEIKKNTTSSTNSSTKNLDTTMKILDKNMEKKHTNDHDKHKKNRHHSHKSSLKSLKR